MRAATQQERDTVRRAIGAVFAHLTAAHIARLSETHDAIAYAGAQLGTSSQAKANGEHWDAIGETVDDLGDFYTIEAAKFIEGEADKLPKGARILGQLENEKGERFVLADCGPEAAQQFATWQRDDDGATFWGHYFSDRRAALADLIERAA